MTDSTPTVHEAGDEALDPVTSTIHIDLFGCEISDEHMDAIVDIVYGNDYEALVYQHRDSCEASDHCCGPGSKWLTKQLTAARAQALRDAAEELEGRLGAEHAPRTLWDFRAWLRDRATAIENGETS